MAWAPLDTVAQPDALATALTWLQGVLLGSVATAVATIAVAAIGFMLLAGRIHYRQAAQVVIGCFILFGAPAIVSGITAASASIGGGRPAPEVAVSAPMAAAPRPAPAQPAGNYDPFAGASAPTNYGTCCD